MLRNNSREQVTLDCRLLFEWFLLHRRFDCCVQAAENFVVTITEAPPLNSSDWKIRKEKLVFAIQGIQKASKTRGDRSVLATNQTLTAHRKQLERDTSEFLE